MDVKESKRLGKAERTCLAPTQSEIFKGSPKDFLRRNGPSPTAAKWNSGTTFSRLPGMLRLPFRPKDAPNISRLTSLRPAAKPDVVAKLATRRWWKRDLPPLSPSFPSSQGAPTVHSPAPIPPSLSHAPGRPLCLELRHPRSRSAARERQPTALKAKEQRQPPGGGSPGGRRNLEVWKLLRRGVSIGRFNFRIKYLIACTLRTSHVKTARKTAFAKPDFPAWQLIAGIITIACRPFFQTTRLRRIFV